VFSSAEGFGTEEFRVVFSSAEGFGTEFRDFLFRGTTGIPSEITICSVYSAFRGIIFWSEIPNPISPPCLWRGGIALHHHLPRRIYRCPVSGRCQWRLFFPPWSPASPVSPPFLDGLQLQPGLVTFVTFLPIFSVAHPPAYTTVAIAPIMRYSHSFPTGAPLPPPCLPSGMC
jgi:hypothetical protein